MEDGTYNEIKMNVIEILGLTKGCPYMVTLPYIFAYF